MEAISIHDRKPADPNKSLCSQPNSNKVSRANSVSNAHQSQHVAPVHAYKPSYQTPKGANVSQASSVASSSGSEHPQLYHRSHSDNSMKPRSRTCSARSHSLMKPPTDAEIDNLTQLYLDESAEPDDDSLEFLLSSPEESSRPIKATDSSQHIKSKQQFPHSNPKIKLEYLPNKQNMASNEYTEIPNHPSLTITEKSENRQVHITRDVLPSPIGSEKDRIDGANAKDKTVGDSKVNITHITSSRETFDDLNSILGKDFSILF